VRPANVRGDGCIADRIVARKTKQKSARNAGRTARKRQRLTQDQAVIAVLIAAMDANQHVSREEAWRAHHIIWSMRRFRHRQGEQVDRLIDSVRTRMEREGTPALLREAARTLPARTRPAAFAVAVDLMLADTRLEAAEKRFVRQLAAALKIQPDMADALVRALTIKNSA
jgi:tellurite resistance protein